jgi:hypothetical protein
VIEVFESSLRRTTLMSLIPYVCILVNSVERVSEFFLGVFGCCEDQGEIVEKPIIHRVVQLSHGSSITLIRRDSCNEATLVTFNLYAVKHIFVAVQDLEKVRCSAVKLGAQVTRDDSTNRVTISFMDGVDEITIHVMDAEKKKQSPHEMIMNALQSQCNHGSNEVNREVIMAGILITIYRTLSTAQLISDQSYHATDNADHKMTSTKFKLLLCSDMISSWCIEQSYSRYFNY